jgi:TRAP-type uncharacterized transport system substrate-binding protein
MTVPPVIRASVAAFCLLAGTLVIFPGATSRGCAAEPTSTTNLIHLETGPSTGITVQLGEDIASVVDDGTTRRMIPVIGHGGMRNIAGLLERRGVDIAFVQLDVLDFARTQRLFPGLEAKLSYLAKLNYVEFHLLTRPEVVSAYDLAGQIVSIGPDSGDTAITAAQLFKLSRISFVPGNDDPGLAIG